MENACFYITMKSNLLNIYKILQLCAGMLIQNWCHQVLPGVGIISSHVLGLLKSS